MVKEKPIIFTAESVRAILEGRKTQTRRVVVPQPKVELFPFIGRDNKPTGEFAFVDHPRVVSKHVKPRYQVGDHLWVKETWRIGDGANPSGDPTKPTYAADWISDLDSIPVKWKSPRFMPRWASRITLEVTEVRVQRVQEISEEDARAEGIDLNMHLLNCKHDHSCHCGQFSPQDFYRMVWDSLNAKRGYPWKDNPWVWAYTFKRVNHGQD